MDNSEAQLFIVTTQDTTVGIRMDRILSFTYVPAKAALAVRFIGEANEQRFEGEIAESVLRELRYAGRK